MEKQNKYFTPEYNELVLGDKIQCWHSIDIQRWEDDIFQGWEIDCFKEYIALGAVRVKYLDKSDIESLGWKWFTNASYGEDYEMINNGKRYVLSQIENTQEIYVYLIEKSENCTIFNGQCKSINELRIIHKLLQIN